MKSTSRAVTQDDFARFLAWLDADVQQAGERYNNFHRRLTMYFACRECGAAAPDLASQTLDRAAEKFSTADAPIDREPGGYLFQVASFILLEHFRTRKTAPLDPEMGAAVSTHESEEPVRVRCCKKCLSNLPRADRDLIHDYYLGAKKGEAKRIRFEVAGELGIAQGALRIKAFRLKQKLFQCMRRCVEDSSPEH